MYLLPRAAEELALMEFVMGETGRTVSFEDVLSGRGLERAYRFAPHQRQRYPLRISLPTPKLTPKPDRQSFCF